MMSYLGATELRLLEERVDDDMGASFIPISGNHKLLLSLFGGTISPQDLILPLTDERLFLATTSGSVSFDSTVAAYSCTAILWHSDGLQNGYCVLNDWRHTKFDVEKKWRNCNMNNKTSAATGAGKVWNVWKLILFKMKTARNQGNFWHPLSITSRLDFYLTLRWRREFTRHVFVKVWNLVAIRLFVPRFDVGRGYQRLLF